MKSQIKRTGKTLLNGEIMRVYECKCGFRTKFEDLANEHICKTQKEVMKMAEDEKPEEKSEEKEEEKPDSEKTDSE